MAESNDTQLAASPLAQIDAEGPTLAEASPGPVSGLAAGAKVGRYSVLELIGAGGMGSVYAAYDPILDRRVALKVLKQGSGKGELDRSGQARLLREAQALAKLNHPNIVSVYDIASVDDQLHIAMEYVAGLDLRQWLQAEPRTAVEILGVFEQAGRALQVAHDMDIVHRDFKPENVLVSETGAVLVIDFGIARLFAEACDPPPAHTPEVSPEERNAKELQRLETEVGIVLGTPAYMALEQFYGETDPRSDQFSFAICLYEALYGQAPYGGRRLNERIANIEAEALIAPADSSDVPQQVLAALTKALRAQKEERFPSMSALLEELVIEGPESEEQRRLRAIERANDQGLESRGRAAAGAAAALFVIAVTIGLYLVNDGMVTPYTAEGIFYIALIFWVGVGLTFLRFWDVFTANQYNRRWALAMFGATTAMLVHRAIALVDSQEPSAILQADLFLLATTALMSAHLSRLFYGAAAILASMTCLAVVYPSLTRLFMNGGGVAYAAMVWAIWRWKRRD